MKLPDWLTRPGTIGGILVVSLAANLFLGSIVAGHFGAANMRPPPLFAPGLDNLFRVMPERERQTMRERLRANHPEVMEAHEHLRLLHREIREEIAEDSPDRKLLEHKLHEVREGVELLEKSMHVTFLDTVLALPTEARRRLLEDMRRHAPKGMSSRPGGAGRPADCGPPEGGPGGTDEQAGPPPAEDDEPPID